MSPEQASGEPTSTARSDVYSLACVRLRDARRRAALRRAAARAPRWRATSPRRRARCAPLRPDAPPAVERALARALAKDPADRFADAWPSSSPRCRRRRRRGAALRRRGARCIAVLPFVNASPDPENEYLSDGITDELIDALAKVEGLRVASRTSVFALKGKPQDVRAIGALLGASEVLEGTVRKAGDRLRITAQLSSTDDGRLLWSQRYDRTLDDVFAIQDEIARTIVEHAARHVVRRARASRAPRRYTENVAAYGLYLRGRYAWNKRTQEGVAEGDPLLRAGDRRRPRLRAGLHRPRRLRTRCTWTTAACRSPRGSSAPRRTRARRSSWTTRSPRRTRRWPGASSSTTGTGTGAGARVPARDRPRSRATPRRTSGTPSSSPRRAGIDEALVEGHTALELDPASVSVRRSLGWQLLLRAALRPGAATTSRAPSR